MPTRTWNTHENDQRLGKRAAKDTTRRQFVTATLLARGGRYADASVALRQAMERGECSEVEALDLQARMYAQQGLYLHAESCWRQAKQFAGDTGAYDQALERLRKTRRELGWSFKLVAAATVILCLGVMSWLMAAWGQGVTSQLRSGQSSLAVVQEDIAKIRTCTEDGGRKVVAGITVLRGNLDGLNVRLAERIGTLSTADGAAKDRAALVGQMNEQAAALQKAFERETTNLATHEAEADAATTKRIAALDISVSGVSKALGAVEASLTKQAEANRGAVVDRIDRILVSVREQMNSSSSSAMVSTLDKRVIQLQQQVSDIAAAVNGLADALKNVPDTSDSGHPATAPSTQRARP